MALQKQYREVPVAGGIDVKTDPKQVQPPKTLITDNGYFQTNGMIRKRNGYSPLSTNIQGGGTLTSGQVLGSINGELLQNTSESLYAWGPSSSAWAKRGGAGNIGLTLHTEYAPFVSSPFYGVSGDISGNYLGLCWMSDNGGSIGTNVGINYANGSTASYGVKDITTSQWVIPPVAFPTTATGPAITPRAFSAPLVVAFGTYLYFFYLREGLDGGPVSRLQLVLMIFNTSTLTAGAPSVIDELSSSHSITNATFAFDACCNGVYLFMTAASTTGLGGSKVRVFSAPGSSASTAVTLSTVFDGTARIASATNDIYYGVFRPDTGRLQLMDMSNTLGTAQFSQAYTAGLVPSAMAFSGNGASVTLGIIGPMQNGTGSTNVCIAVPTMVAVTGRSTTVTTAPLTPYVTDTTGSHAVSGILSRPFWVNGVPFCWVGTTGTQSTALQPVGLLHNLNTGQSVARIQYLAQGGIGKGLQAPQVLTTASGYTFPTISNTAIMPGVGVGAANVYQTAVTTVPFSFSAGRLSFLPFNAAGLLNGSNPSYYDGAQVFQQGFDQAPELPTPTQTNTGAMTLLSTYKYVACYRRFDSFGNEHWSAPSPPLSVTMTGANNAVQFAYLGYGPPNSSIVLFRQNTTTGDLNYYELGTLNSTGITEGTADAGITGNRKVYSNPAGGSSTELANDPPPAFIATAATKTRLFGVSAEYPTRLYYSKPFSIGRGPEWSALQFLLVDAATGPIIAMATLDEKVVLLKADATYYTYGDGPDATGASGSFQQPIQIAMDTGCSDPRSVVVTDQGVYFKSVSGIKLLDRGLGSASKVGAAVEPYATTVTSAVLMPGPSQVRFGTNSNRNLVYDYFLQRWCTWSNQAHVSAVNWLQSYAFLTSAGIVNVETTGFLDNATPIVMTVQTPWLPMSGLQGFGRLYRLLLLGDYKSAHTLQTKIYYDYDSTYFDTISYVHDPAAPVYQFRAKVPRQVMQAVSFVFLDTGTTGESYDISSLLLEVGVKSGAAKLPVAKSV